MRRKIEEIRKNKKECDWGKWKSPDFVRACLNYDDCKGCGVYTVNNRVSR